VLAGALIAGFDARTPADATAASGITGRAVASVCGGASAGGQTW
jgi:hypothetical protein